MTGSLASILHALSILCPKSTHGIANANGTPSRYLDKAGAEVTPSSDSTHLVDWAADADNYINQMMADKDR